jgi:arylamine N-acetyltransferase
VRASETFLDHFGIVPRRADRALVEELGAAFANLPYENLTKLIKKHRVPPGAERRRQPAEVVRDHLELGAGGTCFALSRLFAEVLDRVGVCSFPVLCDASRRPAQHCALIVILAGEPHLLDPGYMLHRPLPLDGERGEGEAVRLGREAGSGQGFHLHTYGVHRYSFTLDAVPRDRFERVWDASFDWTMMNGVHLCAPHRNGYAYVHGSKLRYTTAEGKTNLNLRGREGVEIERSFGLAPQLVHEAYAVVAEARALRRQEPG